MSTIDNVPACVVCGSASISAITPRKGLTYLRCVLCGHCASSQLASDQDRAFHEAQVKYYGESSQLLASVEDPFEIEVVAGRTKVLRSHTSPACNVVEVGPGAGHMIRWLRAEGHTVTAIEHSPALARKIADQLEVPVIHGEFEALELPENMYDVFCSFHVIEHVRNPAAHLKKAYSLVRPGGLAFVATPNSRSWQQIMFESLSPNFDSAHLCVFSIKSLQSLCEQAGWRIVATHTPEFTPSWIRVITKGIRRVKNEDEEQTAGKYSQSSAGRFRLVVKAIQILTLPMRSLQRTLGYGNEVFLVLQKPLNPSRLVAKPDL